MPLDTPTLFVVIAMASALMGSAFAVVAYRRYPNLLIWSAALLLHGLAYVLIGARGRIADEWSIVAGNVAISATFALFSEGVCRFQEQRPPRWLVWLPVAITAWAFQALLEDQHGRYVLAGVLYAVQISVLLWLLWSQPSATLSRGRHVVTAGALIVLVVMVLRALSIGLGWAPPVGAVVSSAPLQTLSFLGVIAGLLLLSVGLLMMNQERAEQALQAEQRVDQFRGKTLDLVARGHALRDVLTEMVQGIEQMQPEMACSVLMLDPQGQRMAEGVAPSLPGFYNQAVLGLAIGPGVGSCGTAAYLRQRVVVADIATHPYWAPYRQLAAQAGLGACWSQPIFASDNTVLGTFAIYHRRPHEPQARDIRLIEQAASLASIAIERSREAEALRRSELRYRRLVETANEGICVVQGDEIRFMNPKLCQLVGYEADEAVGQSFLQFVHEQDRDLLQQGRRKRQQSQQTEFHYLVRLVTRHLGVRWFELSGAEFEWEAQSATLNFLSDVTDRKQMEERVRQMAYQDPLTLLPNRRLLKDRLGLTMARLKRSGEHGALIFLDLDNFKPLNDQHGHDAGDLLLIEVAQRLRHAVREADTVARFGGDEFVVMLADLGTDAVHARAHAGTVAEKILSALSAPYALSVPVAGGVPRSVEHRGGASVGVVVFRGVPGTEEARIRQADAAMYEAKASGRHVVRFYEGADQPESAEDGIQA
jgi:diguanylate cyclase (GGDEF)-like protein/PAS domain S-box-containing protein